MNIVLEILFILKKYFLMYFAKLWIYFYTRIKQIQINFMYTFTFYLMLLIINFSLFSHFQLSFRQRQKWPDGFNNWTQIRPRCHGPKVVLYRATLGPNATRKIQIMWTAVVRPAPIIIIIEQLANRTICATSICWLRERKIYGANWVQRNDENC